MLTDELTGYFDSSSGGRGRMRSGARPLACYLICKLLANKWGRGRGRKIRRGGYTSYVMRTNRDALTLAAAAILAVSLVCLGILAHAKWSGLLEPLGGL